jgi:hypothetical protein
MKLQLPSPSLGAVHHLQVWCALVAPNQAPRFELSYANYHRTNPACAFALPPIPQVFLITATPLNLHKRFLLPGGFLQTSVSDALRTPPEIFLPFTSGRIRYSTSVCG